eukprot:PhF_6_TR31868/c0_g1_i3/m.47295
MADISSIIVFVDGGDGQRLDLPSAINLDHHVSSFGLGGPAYLTTQGIAIGGKKLLLSDVAFDTKRMILYDFTDGVEYRWKWTEGPHAKITEGLNPFAEHLLVAAAAPERWVPPPLLCTSCGASLWGRSDVKRCQQCNELKCPYCLGRNKYTMRCINCGDMENSLMEYVDMCNAINIRTNVTLAIHPVTDYRYRHAMVRKLYEKKKCALQIGHLCSDLQPKWHAAKDSIEFLPTEEQAWSHAILVELHRTTVKSSSPVNMSEESLFSAVHQFSNANFTGPVSNHKQQMLEVEKKLRVGLSDYLESQINALDQHVIVTTMLNWFQTNGIEIPNYLETLTTRLGAIAKFIATMSCVMSPQQLEGIQFGPSLRIIEIHQSVAEAPFVHDGMYLLALNDIHITTTKEMNKIVAALGSSGGGLKATFGWDGWVRWLCTNFSHEDALSAILALHAVSI